MGLHLAALSFSAVDEASPAVCLAPDVAPALVTTLSFAPVQGLLCCLVHIVWLGRLHTTALAGDCSTITLPVRKRLRSSHCTSASGLVPDRSWLGALGVTRADKDYFVHPHLSKLFFRRLCVLESHQAEVKHAKTHFELRLLKEEAVFGAQFLKIPVNSSVSAL